MTNPPPPFSDYDLAPRTPLSGVAHLLTKSGHYKWGLTIYRTTYDDEDLFNEFFQRLQHGALKALEDGAPQYKYCAVIDAACLNAYRAASDWDKEFYASDIPVKIVPAFWETLRDEIAGRWIPEVDDEEDLKYFNFPEVEGCKEILMDWMLCRQRTLLDLYEGLYGRGWYDCYARPPTFYQDDLENGWKIIGA
ncbi:hypothetical protein BDV06DRAFT_221609 [Aspergillus oleicola]